MNNRRIAPISGGERPAGRRQDTTLAALVQTPGGCSTIEGSWLQCWQARSGSSYLRLASHLHHVWTVGRPGRCSGRFLLGYLSVPRAPTVLVGCTYSRHAEHLLSQELDQTAQYSAEGRSGWLTLSTHRSATAVPLQEASGGRAPVQRPMLSASRSACAASNLEPGRRHNAHSAAAVGWRYGPGTSIRPAATVLIFLTGTRRRQESRPAASAVRRLREAVTQREQPRANRAADGAERHRPIGWRRCRRAQRLSWG